MTKEQRLQELLAEMDVPSSRVRDWNWLLRNLGIRNRNHPEYRDTILLIKEMVCKEPVNPS